LKRNQKLLNLLSLWLKGKNPGQQRGGLALWPKLRALLNRLEPPNKLLRQLPRVKPKAAA
jgi:hypothetical protein